MKRGSTPIKSGSTIFAKAVVYLVGVAALAVCFILLPELVREESVGKPTNLLLTYTFLGGAYVLSTPFFVALYQALKFLTYIDKNKAFSNKSIKALRNIKICATIFSVLVVVALVVGISVAKNMDPNEDVTGFVTLGFVFTFISSVIAVFVAVIQKLLTDAVHMKSENDLII